MRKILSKHFFAAIAAFATMAIPASALADMGRTAGSWDVAPSGAGTYTIPLWVQPGARGVQPSLAFVYNSQGSNGTMGVGWSLAGFSSIDRCPSTNAEDGTEAAVKVDQTDRFCLGSNKLRITSGPVSSYGTQDAVYQTSNDEFARITSIGFAGTGPLSFLVHTKNGRVLEYGNTPDSRVVLSGQTVYRWLLNKVSDRDGNSYVVTYTTDNSTGRVPLTVSWGATAANGSTYQYQAALNYTNKWNPNDWVSGRLGSSTIVTKQRLDSVVIGYSASGSSYAPQRQYVLAYNGLSPTTGRTRLTSITECAATTSNCFKPTTMTYQSGQPGVSSTAQTVPSVSGAIVGKFDFNGDGRNDLAYRSGTWRVALSTGAGFSSPIDTGVPDPTPQIGRYTASRNDGFLFIVSGVWRYAAYNGSAFTTTSTGISSPGGTLATATDTNGDGLIDIVHSSTALSGSNYFATVHVRLNNTTGAATVPSFASSTYAALTTNVGPKGGAINFLPYDLCPTERQCDINGDGAPDLNVVVTTTFGCGPSGCSASSSGYDLMSSRRYYTLVNSRTPTNAPYIGFHFNSDPCVDTILANSTTLRVNSCGTGATSTVSLPASFLTFMDWDGDERSDLVVNNGGTIGIYKSTGTISSPFSSLITTTVPYNSACKYFPADVEGDGLDELVCVTSSSTMYYSHSGNGSVGLPAGNSVFITQVADLLSNITDGYGLSVSPSYVSTPQSNYTKGTGTAAPLVDAADIIYAVGRVRISDGFGVAYDLDYTYSGARRNRSRGNLVASVGTDESGATTRAQRLDGEWAGFETVTVVDGRNGLKTKTTYEQLYPLVGMVKKTEVFQADGKSILIVTNTNTSEPLDTTEFNTRQFSYVSQRVSDTYEVGGPLNGQVTKSSTETFGYSFPYGNLATATTVITDKDSSATPSRYNDTWTTAITNLYEPARTTGGDWCIGFVKETKVAQSSTASGPDPVTRTVAFAPDPDYLSKCRIKTKTVEPLSEPYRVTETYGYDAFGNVNNVQLVGREPADTGGFRNMATRTTLFDWGTTGQFMVGKTDASGANYTFSYYPQSGKLKEAFDPNSTTSNVIKSVFEYDDFWRARKSTRPDGTYSIIAYADCASSCVYPTHKLTVSTTEYDVQGAVITDSYVYSDTFERAFATRERLLNGTTWNGSYQWTETQYDALGHAYKEYMPCTTASASASCRLHAITNTYDLLNRLTQTSRPVSQSDSTVQSTSIAYSGRTQTFTDPAGKLSTRVVNVDGTVRRIKDANDYAIDFSYDPAGSLVGIVDSEGASRLRAVTVHYGVGAFQVAATDRALGAQTNTYNSLGELVTWTDAKGQVFRATYDELSRPLTRLEPNEATRTRWEWGNRVDQFNMGLLKRIESVENGETYAEDFTYDNRARLKGQSISIPGFQNPFQYDFVYHPDKGWVDTLKYPANTDGYRLELKNSYQNGILQSVSDANVPATVFWTANSTDSWAHITQETLGNGVIRSRTYDAVNGRVSSIQAGTGVNPTSIQNLSYLFDLAGNVSQRQNNKLALTETFSYGSATDNLHRLASSTLNNGSATSTNLELRYDKSGNIVRKIEPGAAELPPDQTVTWTTYNYPRQIDSGGERTTFAYGPERQRWRMVYTADGAVETTHYIGGMLERVENAEGVAFRHTIDAGGGTVAIYTRSSSGPPELQYVLSDHQGSTESFVNGTTGAVLNASFSPFGTRRNSATWAGDPTNRAALDEISREGYTDHTVLGSMDLNHMNGRVQDAANGMFLSGDPYVSQPDYTQNYNRYSYLYGNPLTLTDPSGFCGESGYWPQYPCLQDCKSNPLMCVDAARDYARRQEEERRRQEQERDAQRREASERQNNHSNFNELATEFGKGTWDSLAQSYWYRPFNPENPGFGGGPMNLAEMFGPYQSPFKPPQTSEGQLARDLGPIGALGVGLLMGKVMSPGAGVLKNTQVGYHATRPEYVKSIMNTKLNPSVGGRAGSGVYVSDSVEGALAEFAAHNPGVKPVVLKVEYTPGSNAFIEGLSRPYLQGPLPLAADTIGFGSVRLPGTVNTVIRNESAVVLGVVKQ